MPAMISPAFPSQAPTSSSSPVSSTSLFSPVASRARTGRGARILALEIDEREIILRALEDGPHTAALAEPRGVLLAEHVGRKQTGL